MTLDTGAKIGTGISVIVITGLIAFAVAPMLAGTPTPASAPASAAVTASTAEPEPASASAPPAGPDTADVPQGYVNLGNGTFIPGGGPGDCTSSAWIEIASYDGKEMTVSMLGADLVDTGPREFAVGEVALDDEGRPMTYTVAPGDVLTRIADRFCIYNGGMLGTMNNYLPGNAIQPGDVLALHADYATDFVYPYPME